MSKNVRQRRQTDAECWHGLFDTTWKVIREIWGAQKALFFESNRLWKRP